MADGHDPNRADELFGEANRWFHRLQADDVTSAERRLFNSWLAEDPDHAEAWESVHALMRSLKVPAMASYAARPNGRRFAQGRHVVGRSRSAQMRRGWPRAFAAGLAAILVVAAWVEGPVLIDRWSADHVTVSGERKTITLADGTRIDLDADTALKTDVTEGGRRVSVLRGGAFFDVAADPRPFVVTTREGEARDIGTSFGVESREGRSTVTVETGIVDVKAAARPSTTVRLTAGRAVDYGADGLSPRREADPEQDLAWRRGQIIFRQEKLSRVVARLNRYRMGRIVILNPWVGDELVSGTFDIDRADAPIEALEAVLDVKAFRLAPYLVVLR